MPSGCRAFLNVAHKHGRKVAVTGRSMENILKVSTDLGYLKIPNNTLVDINAIKSLPKDKIVIVSTGSQGEKHVCALPHGVLRAPAGGNSGGRPRDYLRLRHSRQ